MLPGWPICSKKPWIHRSTTSAPSISVHPRLLSSAPIRWGSANFGAERRSAQQHFQSSSPAGTRAQQPARRRHPARPSGSCRCRSPAPSVTADRRPALHRRRQRRHRQHRGFRRFASDCRPEIPPSVLAARRCGVRRFRRLFTRPSAATGRHRRRRQSHHRRSQVAQRALRFGDDFHPPLRRFFKTAPLIWAPSPNRPISFICRPKTRDGCGHCRRGSA